mmetsp:Transcript_16763/g.25829  ORF Transcript_16763/g.25829 Transcript_16763/m.25829 type:complete len:219 (-) Transcript_16763:357-1013(-)
MREVFVDGGGEQVVDALGQAHLGHLQLSEVVHHRCVLEVGIDHLLQDGQVLSSELAQALVQRASDFGVLGLLAVDDSLEVGLALCQVLDEQLEVLHHEVSVGEHALVLQHIAEVVLSDLLLAVENRHRIEVVLSEEKHVEAGLVEVREVELEGDLAEEGALGEEGGVDGHHFDIEAVLLQEGVVHEDDGACQRRFNDLVLEESAKVLDSDHSETVDFR